MARECKLCKFGDGACVQGFRKQHERTDPNCRLHGVTDRGTRKLTAIDSRPRQSTEKVAPSEQPPPAGESAQHPRPLAQLTQFRTKEGNLMLFEPQPMDTWIGKEVLEDESTGGYRDGTTGKPLSKRLAASYLAYRRRHSTRCSMGDEVDKYIRLVDKYQPKVFAEARMYVARFPEEAGICSNRSRKYASWSASRGGGDDREDERHPKVWGKLAQWRLLLMLFNAEYKTETKHRGEHLQ